jgi:hypothetical protein
MFPWEGLTMNDLPMLEKYFPGGTLEGGIKLANRLDWGLSVQMAGDGYVVSSGDEPILRTETKEALQSFIYGIGLAYAILPEELFKALEEALGDL